MKKSIWIPDLINLFFPRICHACREPLIDQENVLCMSCSLKLPRTNFHLRHDNPVAMVFWGRVRIEAATSFLFFNKGGRVQQLMHALKYRGNRKVGIYLGKLFGSALSDADTFREADLIIPVPLHPRKLHKRGYNQSEMIGQGLSDTMDKPLNTQSLSRIVHTASQTRKSRYSRWENVKDVFQVNHPEHVAGRHILLVDDVLTTGATLEACATKLLEVEHTKVSMATLAYAQG
ncbi:MAG: ComF family protein [bacterium]